MQRCTARGSAFGCPLPFSPRRDGESCACVLEDADAGAHLLGDVADQLLRLRHHVLHPLLLFSSPSSSALKILILSFNQAAQCRPCWWPWLYWLLSPARKSAPSAAYARARTCSTRASTTCGQCQLASQTMPHTLGSVAT
eukprot:m.826906 g.826906  ORF g.826906 m.826906 type:complete len:140 (+) comp59424_c0_seq2:2070-2489(+)